MQFKPLVPVQTRSHQIVAQIEGQIRTGELSHGQKLASETQLASEFGVSRSVVREAIKLLEAMGLVSSRQGSGSYVRTDPGPAVSRVLSLSVAPDDTAVNELFEFREHLEVTAARLAAERRTDESLAHIQEQLEANIEAVSNRDGEAFTQSDWKLHSAIAEATGNRYLTVVLTAVREMQHGVVKLITDHIGSLQRAVEQHRRIIDGIVAGDPDKAEAAVREHIRTTAAVIEARSTPSA
ncbi:FadR/GntR family transcriptional regulator [Phytoactinopolyspora endophytica]|uniref:FadR/GntR family transcriptional regulator n=1 Tax=Phytoactinopolyspora endophytica TaxID=1642495 RepID=UPI00101E1DFB|nr:FadR/GntR family transcriptional regulator [Phytoactinopolyspora endophytica]